MVDPDRRRRLLGHLQEHETERAPSDELLPERFRLIRELGRGGMGAVLLAHDVKLNRQVAVKVLLAFESAPLAQRRRFEIEGRALASLWHVHIVPVHELIRDRGALFLVMDFIEGESVAQRLTDGKLEPREAARVALAVAEALACAHEHGVLHRDVKPANVVLADDGGVFLVDFGLAKQIDSSAALTQTGQIMGTPDYLSPEQATDAKTVDKRSDIYALGACLFHMLTGQVVFPAGNLPELLGKLLTCDPPDPRKVAPDVPKDLASLCLRCLQKEPAERYPDANALADDLKAFLAGKGVHGAKPKRRAQRVLLGLVPAAALLLLVTLVGVAANNAADAPGQVEDRVATEPPQAGASPAPDSGAEITQPERPPRQFISHDDILDVTFVAGRSDLVVSAAADGVGMWELGPEARQRWKREVFGVTWLAASPDERIIACGIQATVLLLSSDDGRLLATVQVEKRTNVGLWLDDGRELLLGCEAPLGLQRVRTSDWTLLPTARLDYPIHSLAFDPRSATIAWGGGDLNEAAVRRLDLSEDTLEPQAEFLEGWMLTGSPRCIAPGRVLNEWVVGLTNGAIHILKQGQPRADDMALPATALVAPRSSFPGENPFTRWMAHVSRVAGLGFLHNGLLVSCSGRRLVGDLRVWDLERPQPLVGLAIRSGLTIRAMRVSPDGRWVALGTQRDGLIVLSAEWVVKMAERNGTVLSD